MANKYLNKGAVDEDLWDEFGDLPEDFVDDLEHHEDPAAIAAGAAVPAAHGAHAGLRTPAPGIAGAAGVPTAPRAPQPPAAAGGSAGAARDRAGEGSDSTPPDIPADGSYADPSPHRARLDFEGGASAGAPGDDGSSDDDL